MQYRRNNDFFHAYLDNEVCLFDPTKGKYHNLNKVGSNIWEILENQMEINNLVEILMDKFNVSKEECYSDTSDFLKTAVKEGILIAE